jgi:hypothetical protein
LRCSADEYHGLQFLIESEFSHQLANHSRKNFVHQSLHCQNVGREFLGLYVQRWFVYLPFGHFYRQSSVIKHKHLSD